MEVAPFRALTRCKPFFVHCLVNAVEMEVAPFRALTQTPQLLSLREIQL